MAAPDRSIALLAACVIAAMLATPAALAQQPRSKGELKAQQKGPSKGGPKGPAVEPPKPGEPPKLVFRAWVKICQKGPEANSIRICLTGKDGRVEGGMPVVSAVLIEPEGQPRKILRVTLPLGMSLAPGTRVIVDDGQPMNAPYVICLPNGCSADYEASDELIGKMKRGRNLNVQGINASNQPVTLPIPLADFGKAHEGPPTDPSKVDRQ